MFPSKTDWIVHSRAIPVYPWEIGSRTPMDTEIQGCLSLLYKTGSFSTEPMHILLYILNHLKITYNI